MILFTRRFFVSFTTVVVLFAPTELRAQLPTNATHAGLGTIYTLLDLERPSPTGKRRASGPGVIGEAELAISDFFANARLASGSLDFEDADGSVTLVEGELMVGYRVLRWLALEAGPHFRKVDTPSQSDNWVFWEGRLLLGATLLQRIAYSYVNGWLILSASEPDDTSFDNGFGFEAGVFIKTTTLPVWLKTGYRIDRATFNELSSADTVQQLILLLGINFDL